MCGRPRRRALAALSGHPGAGGLNRPRRCAPLCRCERPHREDWPAFPGVRAVRVIRCVRFRGLVGPRCQSEVRRSPPERAPLLDPANLSEPRMGHRHATGPVAFRAPGGSWLSATLARVVCFVHQDGIVRSQAARSWTRQWARQIGADIPSPATISSAPTYGNQHGANTKNIRSVFAPAAAGNRPPPARRPLNLGRPDPF